MINPTFIVIPLVLLYAGGMLYLSETYHTTKRHNACIDAGGVPVYFEIHTKGLEKGYKCIVDFKLVEVK